MADLPRCLQRSAGLLYFYAKANAQPSQKIEVIDNNAIADIDHMRWRGGVFNTKFRLCKTSGSLDVTNA